MISSLNRVNFSTPVSVTRKLFSIPTAPTPGITNLGSKANTIFGKSSSFERGVSTGSSLICIPMPCPTNLACCSVPIKLAERPSFLAIFAAILYKSEQAVPGRVAFSTSYRKGHLMRPISFLRQAAYGEDTGHVRHISRIIAGHIHHDSGAFF